MAEHDLFYSSSDVLASMHPNDQLNFLPHFSKVVKILNIKPETSCSAERSFCAFCRLKTYLRSTMGHEHLSHLAILSIERYYANKVTKEDIDKIIDKIIDEFSSKTNCAQHF